MHSAGCNHTPVFNADIRSGYSACRAFALPSAAHYAVPLSTWFSATHALCVRAYDFTSASSVWLMKLYAYYSHHTANVKTVLHKKFIVPHAKTAERKMRSAHTCYAKIRSLRACFSLSERNVALMELFTIFSACSRVTKSLSSSKVNSRDRSVPDTVILSVFTVTVRP